MTISLSIPMADADQLSPTGIAVAELAYKLWTERAKPIGSPEEDWFAAICQIKHSRTPGSVL
jgi:Protein of unknown function (DUF2934)